MDLGILNNYTVIVVMGLCLCVGYVIKNSLDFIKNKYIPLIMAVMGIVLNLINCCGEIMATKGAELGPLVLQIVLSGAMSGLLSTGVYEAFRGIIEGKDK